MSEGSIQHGIFEITSTGKTQRYFAEDFGGAQEALSILHLISLDMRRTPKGSVIDVNRLISRFEKIPLDDLDTRLPMFVPLEQSGYEHRMAELEEAMPALRTMRSTTIMTDSASRAGITMS